MRSRAVRPPSAGQTTSQRATATSGSRAHPRDGDDADCYLVSRATNAKLEAAYDKRRRRLRGDPAPEQELLGEEP